jgi:hypothetical protein
MKTGSLMLAAVIAAPSGLAHAQFSSTLTLVSDYEFRGVSLTETDPALQASLDYEFANGIAIGAWASNLDYGDDYDGSFELDFYVSYTGEISESASWSAGLTRALPGSLRRHHAGIVHCRAVVRRRLQRTWRWRAVHRNQLHAGPAEKVQHRSACRLFLGRLLGRRHSGWR